MHHGVIRVAADGSPGSRRALEWALDEAAIRNCAVELLTAYQPADATSSDAARISAEQSIHATMDDIIAGRIDLPLVSWEVVEGAAADVLIRSSAHSELLVLGSHSVDSLRHSALGSVADTCARMADCPVVVIPAIGRATLPHDDLAQRETSR